ncbi:dTMP kinase [bacterium]|nr:dTMP kinase [bacterium]
MFIAIEGLDGSGKSTTVKELKLWLEKRLKKEVMLTQEPTKHPSGKLIREMLVAQEESPLLHEKLALAFATDRLNHLETDIWPALKQDKIVITDRYLFSSIAYQSVAVNYEWVKGLNRFAMLPDLLIYINVSVETALKRIKLYRENVELYETGHYLEQILTQYRKTLDDFSAHIPIIELDGEISPDEIDAEIEKKLGKHELFLEK